MEDIKEKHEVEGDLIDLINKGRKEVREIIIESFKDLSASLYESMTGFVNDFNNDYRKLSEECGTRLIKDPGNDHMEIAEDISNPITNICTFFDFICSRDDGELDYFLKALNNYLDFGVFEK